jgi:aminoglycoside 3-N-acetyltransferase
MSLLVEELKTLGLMGAKRVVPVPVIHRLRDARRRWARRGLKDSQIEVIPQSQEELEAELRKLGVKAGRDLLIHSSMSKIGPVQGGAATVIRALRASAGPDATLVMPAYPMPSTMAQWMRDPAPFNVSDSPSRMGVLTEVFRKMPGVLRSGHPSHSVAALGPDAAAYTADHHKVATPCGPGSPFLVHTQRGGDILCIGTGVGKITSYHVIEDHLDDFPLPVYVGQRMAKDVIFPDGRRERIEILLGDARLSPWRVDNFKPKEVEFLAHLRGYGASKEGKIGEAASHLIDAARFHAMMVDLARQGITIYHRPKLERLSNLLA